MSHINALCSINPTNPRTNPWNLEKNIENWRNWKTQFFWVVHFGFFFQKRKKLLHSHENLTDGSKFLMITLVHTKRVSVHKIIYYTPLTTHHLAYNAPNQKNMGTSVLPHCSKALYRFKIHLFQVFQFEFFKFSEDLRTHVEI